LRIRLPLSRRDIHGYKMPSPTYSGTQILQGAFRQNIVIYPLRIKVRSNKLSYSTNTEEQVSFEPEWDL
jgi:hypothetical protein